MGCSQLMYAKFISGVVAKPIDEKVYKVVSYDGTALVVSRLRLSKVVAV